MCRSTLLLLTVTLSLMTTSLAQTAARANTCCGLMSGKVYCYGGLIFTSTTENKADNVMNVLDISNTSQISSTDLQNMWKTVSYIADSVDLTPRTDPQCLVISDQNRMIINGGYASSTTTQLVNMNVMYNALQNKWYGHSAYTEAPYGKRQIYYGSASYVPGKGAAFYGGFEEFINPNYTRSDTNVSVFAFANGQSRTIGYSQVSYFNVDNVASTWNTPVPVTNAVDTFSARHASILDPVTNTLLFMGGEYRTTNPPQQNSVPRNYSYIKTFNTDSNEWSFLNLTGDIPTSSRIYSTLTLLPSTNRHVLLYGGEVNDAVATDYCYVLNLDTKNWKKQTITAPAGTTLARSRHSSVLVNNNTLFVMWGIDGNKVGLSSVVILNTTNPDAITMSNSFTNLNTTGSGDKDSNNGNSAGSANGGGLSTGATAGIAVGSVAGAILSAFVIWCCIRKKKEKQRVRTHQQQLVEQQQSEYYNRSDVEPMEVDWDKIEDKYIEMPTTNLGAGGIDRFGASPSSVASNTLVNGNGGDTAPVNSAVHPDGVELHQPNTIDSPSFKPKALKPDGGYN